MEVAVKLVNSISLHHQHNFVHDFAWDQHLEAIVLEHQLSQDLVIQQYHVKVCQCSDLNTILICLELVLCCLGNTEINN